MPAGRRQDALAEYRAKRQFESTPEPAGRPRRGDSRLYTIQKHAARRLHYDLRLELDGVLKSWAVPKGPSLDPAVKRLAVRTEDHPVDYATFEGRIPEGNYGAGTVLLWDRGTWEPVGDPREGLEKGKLVFRVHGDRLKGRWALVRTRNGDRQRQNWLLIKERDSEVDREADVAGAHMTSVASGRDIDAIAAAPAAEWHSNSSEDGQRAAAPAQRAKRRRRAAGEGALPRFVKPALATLVDDLPQGDRWVVEMKFDGYRSLAAASGEDVRIYTRNGLDWTRRYPAIAEALGSLDLPGVLLDGEVVIVDDEGRTDFAALQRAMKGENGGTLSYLVFDLLAESGESLRGRPLLERKARLKALLGEAGRKGPVFYTDHFDRHGAAVLARLCEAGFEGVIAKRADAPYRSGRGRSWLKIKCDRQHEFVIVGWSPSTRNRPFSSVLLGVHEDGALRYAGRVGTGFSGRQLQELSQRFRPASRQPVSGPVPREVARAVHWVRPELVAQVAFAGFTRDGLVRQGRFVGLREDKRPEAVVREEARPVREVADGDGNDEPAGPGGIRLTHPDRVLFPEQGVTKRDLASYMDAVADRMMPYVEGRLLTLVRCPEGRSGSCFYQRHAGQGLPAQFRSLPVSEKGGKKGYIYIEGRDGLLAAAQMGVLELHIWGSRIDKVEKPDRIVFDLDPDQGLDFDAVKQAALRLRNVLAALDLQSFVLLTGGKGVHVVAPIERRYAWPQVKAFTRAVAERIVEDAPDRYVATMSKAKRKGRVFIDFFRNDRTATAIAPYSPRKHAGAPLAWPVTWRELNAIASASEVTIETAARRLRRADPWKDYAGLRQGLKVSALRALGL